MKQRNITIMKQKEIMATGIALAKCIYKYFAECLTILLGYVIRLS